MIISASRRTDIPAFYSDCFFNRHREGYVCARNPMNLRQVSKISLDPDVVAKRQDTPRVKQNIRS